MSDAELWMQAVQRNASPAGATGPRVQPLTQLQRMVRGRLALLVSLYWRVPAGQRPALVRPYLAALHTAKLVADDVFVEGMHAAATARDDGAAVAFRKVYVETVHTWIKGSPLLNPSTTVGNETFIPVVRNAMRLPYTRALQDYLPSSSLASSLGSRAAAAVRDELGKLRLPAGTERELSIEATHMLGLLFLRAQLDLNQRWLVDATLRSGVDSWYLHAQAPVDALRHDVLDVVGLEVRRALVAGDLAAAGRLRHARDQHVALLANVYSMRSTEAGVLFTFFVKQHTSGRFSSEDAAVGVNAVTEIISAYPGNPDPDKQDARAARGVSDLLAERAKLVGTRVRAFGLLDISRSRLVSELQPAKSLDVSFTTHSDAIAFAGRTADRRVLVEGVLTEAGGLAITEATLQPHSNAYVAGVGFPLRFGQPVGQRLRLVPAWRRAGPGLEAEDLQERDAKSVPAVLAGQDRLVADLLEHDELRSAFANGLARSKRVVLDLQHTPTRTKAWSLLFAKFKKTAPATPLEELFALMQRYLEFYTRHTYFNLRDSGANYVTSPWPTDLTGSVFHDCGVYAVRMAYDISRAVSAANVKVEFRFVTFLNHVCLVGTADGQSFLVNNDRIRGPKLLAAGSGPALEASKIGACFDWAQTAYADVYDVDFAIFPVVVPRLTIDTARSEPVFKSAVMATYLKSLGWGISAAAASSYFPAVRKFNVESGVLFGLLKNGGLVRENVRSPKMTAATDLAVSLYATAAQLARRKNFVIEARFASAKGIPRIGFASKVVPPPKVPRSLPMYDLVDLLLSRTCRSAKQDKLVLNPVRGAHVGALTEEFLNPKP